MSGVSGSSEAADNLRTDITSDIKQITELLQLQAALLRGLSSDCRDDSYELMDYLVRISAQKLKILMPKAAETCRNLQAYSDFITRIEKRYCKAVGAGSGSASPITQEKWCKTNQGMQFDSPNTLAKKLDIQQGKTGRTGTCGLCSVENVAIMAGKTATEESVVQLAESKNLCSRSGGTTPESRQVLLKELGINSRLEPQSVNSIAAAVMSGSGVILSVDANKLYGKSGFLPALHAVTVTSVTTDTKGNISGITICDSNALYLGETGAKTYPVDAITKALTKRPMNVTEPIR